MSGDDLGDNVTKLGVRFKEPTPPGRTLLRPHEVARHERCSHYPGHFIVDESLAEVTCADCKEKLNPIWVLGQLTGRDRQFADAHKTYHEQMKRLSERERTKCEKCGYMTRISRR